MSSIEKEREEGIKESLDRIETHVNSGNYNLKGLGFWGIVSKVKKDASLIEIFGDQIGRIDQKVFREKAVLPVNIKIGNLLEIIGTVFGLVVLIYAFLNSGSIIGLAYVFSCLILMTTLHPLSHYIIGRHVGIDFTFYFLNGPAMIEPTLKTDYASYLKASPKSRALMHAIGPIITTLIPVIIGIFAYISGAPNWSYILLLLIFLVNIPNEIMPILVSKIGLKGILAEKLRKTDSYRTYREWKIYKES